MAPEEDQQKRGEIIRSLEDEKLRLNREKEKLKPGLDRQLAETEAKILRAKAAANDPSFGTEFCFECWVELRERVALIPQSAGRAEDVYRCRNDHEKRVKR